MILFAYPIGAFSQSGPFQITEVSKNNIKVKNISNYHLRFEVEKKGQIIKSINVLPDSEFDVPSRFSRRSLKATKISVQYNNNTYSSDYDFAVSRHLSNLANIRNSKSVKEKELESEFQRRLICAVNSSEKSTNIVERLANTCQYYYNFKDAYNHFDKPYESIYSFLKNLAEYEVTSAVISKVGQELEKNLGTNKEANANVIKSCIYYVQNMAEIPNKIELALREENIRHEEYLKEIKSLFINKDYNRTYSFPSDILEKSNLSPVTPLLTLQYEPLIFGGNLNNAWQAGPSILLPPKTPNTNSITENHYLHFGNSIRINYSILPELNYGFSSAVSRLYLTMGYATYKYKLREIPLSLSANLFSQIPNPPQGYGVKFPIGYNQKTFLAGLLYKTQFNSVLTFDIGGGYMKQTGELDFTNSELNAGFEWKFDNLIITNSTYIPYVSLNLELGFPRSKFKLIGGLTTFKPTNISNTADYYLVDNTQKSNIGYKSEKWINKLQIGALLAL